MIKWKKKSTNNYFDVNIQNEREVTFKMKFLINIVYDQIIEKRRCDVHKFLIISDSLSALKFLFSPFIK